MYDISGIYSQPPQTLNGCKCSEPCGAADWFHCGGAEFCIVEKGSCTSGDANKFSTMAEFDMCVYDADQNYEAKNASEKLHVLLQHIDQNSHTAVEAMNTQLYASGTLFSRIAENDVRHVFEIVSDVFPKAEGRQQLREAGVIGTIKFVSAGGHPYTGLFQGAEHGLVRFSIADSPSSFFQPSMGIKLLRDGRPSANLVAMAREAAWGQPCSLENFFHYDFANHLPPAEGMHAEVIVGKFSQASTCPLMVGLSDFASTGAATPVAPGSFPFQLVFKPVVNATCRCADYAGGACFGNLSALATGPLFEVLAQASPAADLQSIGEIVLTSKLTPSSFGDGRYFHKHQRMEEDFAIQPQWLGEIDKELNCGFKDVSTQLPSVEGSCSRFSKAAMMRTDDACNADKTEGCLAFE